MVMSFFFNGIYVSLFVMMFSFFSLFIFRKQLLIFLLSLEFVNLMMFLSLVFKLSLVSSFVSFSFFLLILGACEAGLGLSLMVSMTRFKGGDMLSELNSFKC